MPTFRALSRIAPSAAAFPPSYRWCCRTSRARRRAWPTGSTCNSRQRSMMTNRPASSPLHRPCATGRLRVDRDKRQTARGVRPEKLAGAVERFARHQVDPSGKRQLLEQRNGYQRARLRRTTCARPSSHCLPAQTASGEASFRMLRGRCRSRQAVSSAFFGRSVRLSSAPPGCSGRSTARRTPPDRLGRRTKTEARKPCAERPAATRLRSDTTREPFDVARDSCISGIENFAGVSLTVLPRAF